MTSTAVTKLSKKKHREHHEAIIRDGLKSMSNIGHSLRAIRDEKSYDDEYATFEEYCLSVWKFTRGRAEQYISAVVVLDEMKAVTDERPADKKSDVVDLPTEESHVRALRKYADTPEDRLKLWKHAVAAAGDKAVTAGIIKKSAEELFGPLPESPSKAAKKEAEPATESDDDGDGNESEETSDDPPVSDYRGAPSHGATFNPSEWTPPEEDEKTPAKIPAHCLPIIEGTKKIKDIRNRITQLKKDLRAFCDSGSGSWFNVQTTDRLIDQLFTEVKFRMYECPCPRCRGKINPKCDRCDGRGWLDAGHAIQNTDADKAWLEKISK